MVQALLEFGSPEQQRQLALVGIVAAQHGSFFLQRLVGVLRVAEAAACILHEEIIASIGSLVTSEVSPWCWISPSPQAGMRLVQVVVRLGPMCSVVRVAHWLDFHMEQVVRCRPAVFTAGGEFVRGLGHHA